MAGTSAIEGSVLFATGNQLVRYIIRQSGRQGRGIGFANPAYTYQTRMFSNGTTTIERQLEDSTQTPIISATNGGNVLVNGEGVNVTTAGEPGFFARGVGGDILATFWDESDNVVLEMNQAEEYIYAGYPITNADEDPQCAVCIKGENAEDARIGARFFGTPTTTTGAINVGSARGTIASPADSDQNDQLGVVNFVGHSGVGATGFSIGARILATATEDRTTTEHGTDLAFYTVETGSSTLVEGMRLKNNQTLQLKGELEMSVLTTSSSTNTGAQEAIIYQFNASSTTLTLQTADAIVGQFYIVKNTAGSGNVTVDTQGSETIDGSASITI